MCAPLAGTGVVYLIGNVTYVCSSGRDGWLTVLIIAVYAVPLPPSSYCCPYPCPYCTLTPSPSPLPLLLPLPLGLL